MYRMLDFGPLQRFPVEEIHVVVKSWPLENGLWMEKVVPFVQRFGIKLIHSTLYYAQANKQVKATNKIMIDIIKKNLEDHPRKWKRLMKR